MASEDPRIIPLPDRIFSAHAQKGEADKLPRAGRSEGFVRHHRQVVHNHQIIGCFVHLGGSRAPHLSW